jgi:chorismate mutase
MQYEDGMTLEELREQIDVLDRQLVELLSERARAAQMIGYLKAATSLPVYEPAREKVIYANVRAANTGPLPDIELTHIYERIIDVMRALQRDELASQRHAQAVASGFPAIAPAAENQGGAPGRDSDAAAGAPQPQPQGPIAGNPSETPETGKKP